jgi:hypothetical protein
LREHGPLCCRDVRDRNGGDRRLTAGEIETTGDADWFRIALHAGVTFRFDPEGPDTGQGQTLQAPWLELSGCERPAALSDSSSGGSGRLQLRRIAYTASSGGSFFLASDPLGTPGLWDRDAYRSPEPPVGSPPTEPIDGPNAKHGE